MAEESKKDVSSSGSKEEERGRGRSRSPSRRTSDKSPSGLSKSPSARSASAGRGSPSRKRRDKSPSGRSRSPPKFGEKDFHKNSASSKQKNSIAKARGLRMEPSEWSRQELMDKLQRFSKFVQDRKTGGGELVIEGKKLMTEDIAILGELFKRNTEIQTVKFINCGVTDDIFRQLSEGLRALRHLKHLILTQNMMTSVSVALLISLFGNSSRNIDHLNLRGNNLTFRDGELLLQTFFKSKVLNGINIELIKKGGTNRIIDLSETPVRQPEVGIVCALLESVDMAIANVNELKFIRCNLNSVVLSCIVDLVEKRSCITSLHLSSNDLANGDTDMTGLNKLVKSVQKHTQLLYLYVDQVPMALSTAELLQQSMQVNRSVAGLSDGAYFSKFISSIIEKTAKPAQRSQLVDWIPTMDAIDVDFVKNNHLPLRGVTLKGDTIKLTLQQVKRSSMIDF